MSSTISQKEALLFGTTPEQEWVYLMNETFQGELAIIPLLEDIFNFPSINSALRIVLEKQIEEEIDHVKIYGRHLSDYKIKGSNYSSEFSRYYWTLESFTLKLFALQCLLEGASLGALLFRSKAFSQHPSVVDDVQIHLDEVGHTRFGLAFLKAFQREEGLVGIEKFSEVTADINDIMRSNCSPAAISENMRRIFNIDSKVEVISNRGIASYNRCAVFEIKRAKDAFLDRYYAKS